MKRIIIDVSFAQKKIYWEQVKAAGFEGAIIQCGYGDNISSQDDKYWKYNADECTRLGIPFGVYLYSYATSMEQAESEAQHVLRLVKGYKLSYPIYLDLEEEGTLNGSASPVDRANRFGDIIEAAGYMCGIYANLNWWNNYLQGLNRFTKWIAQYNSQCDYNGSGKDIWQYSSTGQVAGISRNVDMNECYRDFPSELGAPRPTPAPKPQPSDNITPGVNFIYSVRLEDGTILPEVTNLQDFAGIRGKRITDIAIRVSQGAIRYRVHTLGGGWLPWVTGYNWSDHNNGYAGNGRVIDAIQVYYETPADYAAKYGYQKAQYRVSGIGRDYWSWQFDTETGNGQDGYAGCFGQAIDRFQLF